MNMMLKGLLFMDKKFKVLKIDHIAVAVNNIDHSKNIFELLGMEMGEQEPIENERVNVLKIKTNNKNHTIELLEPLDELSVVKKFIDKKGEGIHHIALQVDNVYNAIEFLKSKSVELVYQNPQKGADNSLITFIHPSSTPGVLVELCQKS